MSVLLIGSDGKVYSKDDVKLLTGSVWYRSSKTISKGKYYFECTHINGSLYNLIGFASNGSSSYIALHTAGSLSASIYYCGDVSTADYSRYQKIGWTLPNNKYTVGLGIDADNGQFMIFQEHDAKIITINKNSNIISWNIILVESTGASFQDYVSVNFGQKAFKFKPPFDFVPWQNRYIKCTFINRRNSITDALFFILIIVLNCSS